MDESKKDLAKMYDRSISESQNRTDNSDSSLDGISFHAVGPVGQRLPAKGGVRISEHGKSPSGISIYEGDVGPMIGTRTTV